MLTYRTSHIYPQWVEDAVSASASPFYGNLGPSLSNLATEPVDIGATVFAGELRALLRSQSISDIATVEPAVFSGELRAILKSVSVETEPVELSASVSGGTLKQTLISYSSNEDVTAVSAAVVSGNLS